VTRLQVKNTEDLDTKDNASSSSWAGSFCDGGDINQCRPGTMVQLFSLSCLHVDGWATAVASVMASVGPLQWTHTHGTCPQCLHRIHSVQNTLNCSPSSRQVFNPAWLCGLSSSVALQVCLTLFPLVGFIAQPKFHPNAAWILLGRFTTCLRLKRTCHKFSFVNHSPCSM
jgi:hypothetical protein